MNILVHRVIHQSCHLSPSFWCIAYLTASTHLTGLCAVVNEPGEREPFQLSTSFQTTDSAILGTEIRDHPNAVLLDSAGLRGYDLREVVVTASKLPQTASYSPAFVSVLCRDDIESMGGVSLADVLGPTVGIFIKDYGAASGLKTISQRGLGSEHTLILLNGQRISSFQNGQMDLGFVPTDEIESVEVIRGGQSASYGADAVAGLVNVVTRPEPDRNSMKAAASLGSFGYRRYRVSGSVSSGFDVLKLSYVEERSNENFPFEFHNGPLVFNIRRKNADLMARHASLTGGLKLDETTQLSVRGSAFLSERGVGGPIVGPNSSSIARQIDKDYLLQTSLSSLLASPAAIFNGSAQLHVAYERYQDSSLNIGGETLDNYFRNSDLRIEPRVEFTPDDRVRIGCGMEFVQTSAEGNSLSSSAVRRQMGTYLTAEFTLYNGGQLIKSASLFPAIRFDAISSMSPSWSPQAGAVVGFRPFNAVVFKNVTFTLRSSLSKNFRMPTFNELYFGGGGGRGNPAIRPERSTSFDIGPTMHFVLQGEHVLQATYFHVDMNDRIVWVPAGSSAVTPKNLRHVRSEGLEFSYRWASPEDLLSLQADYTTSSSRKTSPDFAGDPSTNNQLPYVPQETFTLSAGTTMRFDSGVLREGGCTVMRSFVGFRYDTEANTTFLPAYSLVNIATRAKCMLGGFVLTGKLEVNNLFNEDYQVIPGYPMPMRSYRLTIAVEY